MITIFNRRELTTTFSMKGQDEIREKLRSNKIEYRIRTVNRNSPSPFGSSRARTGTFGNNMDLAYEYVFYVHKNDLSTAKAVIQGH